MLPPPEYDLTEEVQRHDVLLAYPYQSMKPFIGMLEKAATDPDVVSIKMTLYRMARESKIVEALTAAAENGKEEQHRLVQAAGKSGMHRDLRL